MIKIETNANCERNRRKYIKSETKVEKKKQTQPRQYIYVSFDTSEKTYTTKDLQF